LTRLGVEPMPCRLLLSSGTYHDVNIVTTKAGCFHRHSTSKMLAQIEILYLVSY